MLTLRSPLLSTMLLWKHLESNENLEPVFVRLISDSSWQTVFL